MKTYQHFIGGEYANPVGGEWFESIDPYRGAPWAKIPRGNKADVDKAVKPPTTRCGAAPGRR